jgi:hypothetical protein
MGKIELKPRLIELINPDPFVNSLLSNKILFKNVNFFILFITLTLYSIQVSLFTLLLAQFFNKREKLILDLQYFGKTNK